MLCVSQILLTLQLALHSKYLFGFGGGMTDVVLFLLRVLTEFYFLSLSDVFCC